jgi:hypothetical protein
VFATFTGSLLNKPRIFNYRLSERRLMATKEGRFLETGSKQGIVKQNTSLATLSQPGARRQRKPQLAG